jgi:hypothetical protein
VGGGEDLLGALGRVVAVVAVRPEHQAEAQTQDHRRRRPDPRRRMHPADPERELFDQGAREPPDGFPPRPC